MTNLPFRLPECGRPAAVRIEAFTIVAGPQQGSLDASIYSCTDHAPDAVTAIEAADMEAHVVPMAPDIDRACGSIHIYPTGNLASDDRHPRWCDRKDCERRGEHRSPARNVDTGSPEAVIVDVALVQNVHPAAEPQISLTGIDGAGAAEPVAVHLLLSIGQARTLRYRLATLIDASKGGHR
ncbi:hypothetical protein [Micromonospora coerulea]|uniref:hypothetical protein n=1 Tax=Micromonospora coerulea TaxID=47856 RepID=UPI001905F694|nr:hypothetical protein [Micromonospora veneta]